MKMKYEKPMVAVDRYELSQAIAGCNAIKVCLEGNACFLRDPDVPAITKAYAANGWFTSSAKDCLIKTVNGVTYDGICYHTQVNGALVS